MASFFMLSHGLPIGLLRLKYWTNLAIWLFSYSGAMKKTIIGLSIMIFPAMLFSQYNRGNGTIKKNSIQELKFSTKQLIVPTILFT